VDRVGGFGGTSDVLAMSQAYLGDPAAYQVKLRREREATPAKVQAAAQRWLSDGEYVAEVFPFGDPHASTTAVDRKQPPVTGPPPELRLPKLERTTLSGGLKVVLAERHEIPLVNFSLLVDSGYAADQFAVPGEAALVSKLLDQGTKTRTSLQIGEQLAQLGATLNVGATMDSMVARLSALKTNLDASLDIFADVALNPSFPQADFLREQKQQLAAIEREKTEPVPLAMRVLPALIYGKGHAYSEPWTGSGTAASVSQLTREDMARFHAAWFKPNHATLMVVGDTTLAEIRPKLEKLFSAWAPGETPQKNVATVSLPERSVVYLIDRPGAQQSLILAGSVAPPRNNPAEVSIESMNNILGGDFGARLNMDLREDKHWTYGALTMLANARGQRLFLAWAPVQTDKTKESMAEIDKDLRGILADHPATEAELARVKASETLRLPGSRETIDRVMSSIGDLVEYGLPEDYYQTYAGKVHALTLADIETSAREVVHPDRLIWVVVGDRAKIEAGIRDLGLGEVRLLNPE
jgi:zinc protease